GVRQRVKTPGPAWGRIRRGHPLRPREPTPRRADSLRTVALDHPTVLRVRAALRAAAVPGEPIVLPDSAPTAAAAAAQLGCEVGAIANSLVFDADGEPLLVLTSGAHRVDTGNVAALLRVRRVERAGPEFVRAHT